MQTNPPTYSNTSSTYWPPGWDFARYARATPADNATLSDDERAKLQAGFREVLGEEGVAEMARVVWLERMRLMGGEKRRGEKGPEEGGRQPPDWMRVWRKRYQGLGGRSWGFVVFWTAGAVERVVGDYGDGNVGGVEGCEERVRMMMGSSFEAALEQGLSGEEVDEARRSFGIRWVRVSDDDGDEEEPQREEDIVERLRARYRSMQEQEPGLFLPIFLVVSSSAAESVLSTREARDGKVGTASPRWRSSAPFLLVVAATEDQGAVDDGGDQDAGGEKDWFKPVFRVAVEVLVDELWPVVEQQMTTLGRMTRFVQRAEVTEDVQTRIDEEDGLDVIWWSVHMPPRHMRKRRGLFT